MNSESRTSTSLGIFLPSVILAASFLVLLVSEILSIRSQNNSLKATVAEIDKALAQREPTVRQAGEIREKFQSLVIDLLELAKTDAKADAVVKRNNLQMPPSAAK